MNWENTPLSSDSLHSQGGTDSKMSRRPVALVPTGGHVMPCGPAAPACPGTHRHHLVRGALIRTCVPTRPPLKVRTRGWRRHWQSWREGVLGGKLCAVGRACRTHLEHVVDDVQLDDRLPPDQVIHHGVVHVVHHEIADDQDDPLQDVTHLGRLQHTSVPETDEK